MKKHLLLSFLVCTLFFPFSCAQDPIFYNISNETKPDVSMILGEPSSFAEVDGKLYTANGYLWIFEGGDWSRKSISGLEKLFIKEVVGKDGHLFVRGEQDSGDITQYQIKTSIYKIDTFNDTAKEITYANNDDYSVFHTLSIAEDRLFTSVSKYSLTDGLRYLSMELGAETFTAFGPDSVGTISDGKAISAAIKLGESYLFSRSDGVFKTDLSENEPTPIKKIKNCSGIVKIGDNFLAYSRSGNILSGTEAVVLKNNTISSAGFEGKPAVYDDGNCSLLLLPFTYSTIYGYREIVLDSVDKLAENLGTNIPGDYAPKSSSKSMTQYKSSIGRLKVSAMYHWKLPNETYLLFAGTSRGLYYSADRGDWKAWSTDSAGLFN